MKTTKPTLSELLDIDLFEMHDAMDILGWTYDKIPEEERTVNIRCCGASVILRGIMGVDTAQCVRCPKLMQNMRGVVPLSSGIVGWIEEDLFEGDNEIWLPVDESYDHAKMQRVSRLPMWSTKARL